MRILDSNIPKNARSALDRAETDGLEDAHLALDAALDKKALEPALLDVRDICSYANYILVLSGRSDRQVEAIAEGVLEALRKQGIYPLGVEGKGTGQWILLDFGDVIAHIFHQPVREHYDIESLWIDARRMPVDIPAQARTSAEDAH